jgi:16S rRNA (cytosine1402-N4)-methyltransferase
MEKLHIPVLLDEVIEKLNIKKNGIYIDSTIGFGGHSEKIIEKIGDKGLLIGIDRDEEAINYCLKKFENNDNVILVNTSFDNIDKILEKLKIKKIDGVLADFGVSSYQLDNDKRGFSFSKEAFLDMRMDKNSELTAYKVVNELEYDELKEIFKKYGEEKFADKIAVAIIMRRSLKPIETTTELAEIISDVVKSKQKIHPATRVFQAIRIYVNDELGNIERFLNKSVDFLKNGGRIACISFHSLEDRIVKNFFKEQAKNCICPPESPICTCNHKAKLKIITKKPITVKEEEKFKNPRARSAKLRIAERI